MCRRHICSVGRSGCAARRALRFCVDPSTAFGGPPPFSKGRLKEIRRGKPLPYGQAATFPHRGTSVPHRKFAGRRGRRPLRQMGTFVHHGTPVPDRGPRAADSRPYGARVCPFRRGGRPRPPANLATWKLWVSRQNVRPHRRGRSPDRPAEPRTMPRISGPMRASAPTVI